MALPDGWRLAGQCRQPEHGQAQVFEVEHRDRPGIICALKRLKDPGRRARFEREISTMKELRDKGVFVIPEIVAKDLAPEHPFYVMPWYDLGSLQPKIEDGTYKRDPEAGIDLMIKLAEAI